MRWKPTGRSNRDNNIEDRRGQGGGGGFGRRSGGLGGGGFPMGKAGGLGGVIVLILGAIFGGGQLFSGGGGGGFGNAIDPIDASLPQAPGAASNADLSAAPNPDDKLGEFIKYVFVDAQTTFRTVFEQGGVTYRPARLVLFTNATETSCGRGSAATGPFYCPPDRTVYIDLGFYRQLQNEFGASGDFAQAYVIAHEVGHHVQNLLGINDDVRRRSQAEPRDANALSVRLELQADCIAGVWAQSQFARGNLEEGDIEEGLRAAEAVGDDRIQRQTTGRISPENFTHGTSEQRAKWFNEGFAAGQINACNTFSVDEDDL